MPSENNDQQHKGPQKPWGSKQAKPQGPPDLDQLLKQLKDKLFKAHVNNSGRANGGGSDNNKIVIPPKYLYGLIAIGIFIIWLLAGIFIVSPAERAVVLRFGKYIGTEEPGPHWIPRFIESYRVINVQRVSNYAYTAEMLTKDENIVSVSVAVQYRADNARDYLFSVVNPQESLQQATASALRQAVGHNTLDSILTTGLAQVRDQVADQLQKILNSYHAGIVVTDVTLQAIRPPEAVTAAFDDAIKAREDQQTYVNQANAYANQVYGSAQGQVARIMQEAEAFNKQVVLEAQGATAGFLALLPEYQKSSFITKQRLYLSAMESILQRSSKILVDEHTQSRPVIYVPTNKTLPVPNTLAETSGATAELPTPTTTVTNNAAQDKPFSALSAESILDLDRPGYPTRSNQ